MKITPQVLSIPPYLSTTWKSITSLQVRSEAGLYYLIVTFENRMQAEVPGLRLEEINLIFDAHARYVAQNELPTFFKESSLSLQLPMQPGSNLEFLTASMKHNPEQANLPPLPPEILEKIAIVTHSLKLPELNHLPPPEPDCGCFYCQIARAIASTAPQKEEAPEETVEDAELQFRDWDIEQKSKELYSVRNPLDPNEQYNVFLGSPLGCTCGKKDCEHIAAVLKS